MDDNHTPNLPPSPNEPPPKNNDLADMGFVFVFVIAGIAVAALLMFASLIHIPHLGG